MPLAKDARRSVEDASTLYLGENSVLVFSDLHTTSGVPFTRIALLSGTVTLHVHPYIHNEIFILKTPTDTLISNYPEKFYARLTSYLDGIAITPEAGGVIRLPGFTQEQIVKGQTLYFRDNRRIDPPASADGQEFAAWDKWVADRITQRAAANATMMEASGLTEPIPGLAEMSGQGHFFNCAPYGTCWEPDHFPTAPAEAEPASALALEGSAAITQNEQSADAVSSDTVSVAKLKASGKSGNTVATPPQTTLPEFFPCIPPALLNRLTIGALATEKARESLHDQLLPPYFWAVCHSGGWTRHHNHYVWVVSHRRHHLPPLRWVKSGRTVAFVPLHPYDVKGRPAVNRNEVVFALNEKNRLGFEPVQLNPSKPLELLDQPPREFRHAILPTLASAEDPHLMAHKVADPIASKGLYVKAPGIPLSFDHKTLSFVAPHQEMHGGRSVTVLAPVTNHGGNLQSHAGFSGGGVSHGGGGGSRSAGSTGGSGSRGGSSSGGGGSHSGGSTSTASSSSSASSAASSHK